MKGWFYILQNPITKRYYTGSTVNIERRLKQHKSGNTRTTRILKAQTLVYKEEYNTIEKARLREKEVKSYKSRKYIEELINGPVAQW